MRASSLRWIQKNFSCARRLDGRCGNMRGPIRVEVRRYVREQKEKLSNLSRREALKNIVK